MSRSQPETATSAPGIGADLVDIHCHFLPGIDDGAADLEQALDLARAAAANGIGRAIMTPHLHPGRWDNRSAGIARHTGEFRRALEQAAIPLEIGYAAEVRLDPEIPMLVERGEVPFLGELDGYRLLLLEFPHGHLPLGADKLVHHLLQMNIRPVIAHPERNKDVMRDPGKILPFAEMGCILQLTAASVCGWFGERAHRTALELLASNAEMVLATDAHNRDARPPVLREGVDALAPIVGEEAAWNMARDLPRRMVASQFTPGGANSATAVPPPAGASQRLRPRPVSAAKVEQVAGMAEVSEQDPRPPKPAPRGGEESATPRPAALEALLLEIIDARLKEPLPGDPAVAPSATLARDYHREIARRLGGQLYRELYRRIRAEVLEELAPGPSRAVGDDWAPGGDRRA